MKQTQVAAHAHISYNYLQRLLAGDRRLSDQVVYKLAQALRLSAEQTGDLLTAAGYAPPLALLQSPSDQKQADTVPSAATTETGQGTRLIQELCRLAQEIPEALQGFFSGGDEAFTGLRPLQVPWVEGQVCLTLISNLLLLEPRPRPRLSETTTTWTSSPSW